MNNFQKLKVYNHLAKPNPWYFILMIVFNLALYGVDIYFAYPSANVITSMTIADYNAAITWLIVCFAIIAVQYLLHTLIHRTYYAHLKNIYRRVHGELYDKVLSANAESFSTLSKEKIVNTVYGSIGSLEEFPYYFARYISHFIQVVVSVVLILQTNILIGSVTIVACVLIFLLQNFSNKRRAVARADYYKYQDYAMEVLSDTYTNHNLTQDLALEKVQERKFISNISKSQKANVRLAKHASIAENIIPLICKLIVYAISIYMVFLTKSNIFTLALYLVLVKYLTNVFTKMSSAQYVLMYINNAYVASMRFKTIFDMKDEDLAEFGTNATDNIQGEIVFANVSYIEQGQSITGSLEPLSLTIKANSINVINGAHLCGKRAMLYMLNRYVRPSTGTITIGGINIYDFDRQTYSHNISFTTSKPYFYNDTIMNNMLLSGASKSDIYNICKQFGLHSKIVESLNSYNTNLSTESILSKFDLYLLGIARAVCSDSEVVVIYETPSGLTTQQKNILLGIIKEIAKKHTVLIFTASEMFNTVANNVYKIEKGKLIKK